jgi:hypothetical protein
MTSLTLFDVIALKIALPEYGLAKGDIGTVLEHYADGDCEVEFTDEMGETVTEVALTPDQFDVVWSSTDVNRSQLVQQLLIVVKTLDPAQAREVLDFAQFLQARVETHS